MKITNKVTIKCDTKIWDKMEKRLLRNDDRSIDVGWFDNIHHDGIPVAQIAAWNEETHYTPSGAISPARPFIRVGFMGDIRKGDWVDKYIPYVNLIAQGKLTWVKLLKKISVELKELLQKHILEWNTPRNSKYTIDIKGFDDPLIHTGKMYDTIKTRIVRR